MLTSQARSNLKAFLAQSKVARLAVLICTSQAVIQVILEIAVTVLFVQQLAQITIDPNNPDLVRDRKFAGALSVYHGIFLLAAVWQPILTVDSIASQNSIQLIIVQVLNVGLFGYAVVQYLQESAQLGKLRAYNGQGTADTTGSLILHSLNISISAVFMFTTVFWTYKLRGEYDWAIYRKVGADRATRNRLTVYFVLMMMLKLDVFSYFTFAVQFLVILYQTTGDLSDILIHVGVSLIMIPILYLACTQGIKRESHWITGFFMMGTLGAIGYLIDKLRQVLTQTRFDSFRRSLSFAIVGCILMAMITFCVSWLAVRNFGLGLNQHILNKDQTNNNANQDMASGDLVPSPDPSHPPITTVKPNEQC